jgi:hypothetical protein
MKKRNYLPLPNSGGNLKGAVQKVPFTPKSPEGEFGDCGFEGLHCGIIISFALSSLKQW